MSTKYQLKDIIRGTADPELSEKEKNLVQHHRDILAAGKQKINSDKSITTILMTGIKHKDPRTGEERIYTVPGYWGDQKIIETEGELRKKVIEEGGFERWPSYPVVSTEVSLRGLLDEDIGRHPANVAARKVHKIIEDDSR